ncbi:DUF4402 domain-containing protein [Sphingopyxis sp. FD7]|jgi:hypothetical protein|uniref:DUF4402 domain-containing protein n=1 Tax=Sphingopyxis sp. FD7 TaxID=1914525 RepID=UPI000DC63EC9|nr:DUF4402 domain-containing protein [Sphingopyxis sp. FD7]BBB13681.1 hypothetical protein SPYCA_2939 [Sphingopyxis sp. FD7]
MKLRLFLFAVLLSAASSAAAQCLLCAQDAAAVSARKVETPLRVDVETRLDMGRIAVGAMGGEVAIDPASGARQLRGDVVDLGGFALSGTVTVRGEPGAEVRVILPASIDLESGHGRTARVTGLVTDLSAAPRLGPDGRLRFRFGGRLQVAARDDGDYRGRIPVTVEYQ